MSTDILHGQHPFDMAVLDSPLMPECGASCLCELLADDNLAGNSVPLFKEIADKHMFHHEYYFIAQLFDDQWILPTATISSVQS